MTLPPDLTMAGIRMAAGLLVLLGGLLAVLYAVRRLAGAGRLAGRPIRILASSYLGPRKVISLVEIPGKILVLGVTKNDIRLLDRIEDAEVIGRFRSPDGEGRPSSFREQLKRLTSMPGKER